MLKHYKLWKKDSKTFISTTWFVTVSHGHNRAFVYEMVTSRNYVAILSNTSVDTSVRLICDQVMTMSFSLKIFPSTSSYYDKFLINMFGISFFSFDCLWFCFCNDLNHLRNIFIWVRVVNGQLHSIPVATTVV